MVCSSISSSTVIAHVILFYSLPRSPSRVWGSCVYVCVCVSLCVSVCDCQETGSVPAVSLHLSKMFLCNTEVFFVESSVRQCYLPVFLFLLVNCFLASFFSSVFYCSIPFLVQMQLGPKFVWVSARQYFGFHAAVSYGL